MFQLIAVQKLELQEIIAPEWYDSEGYNEKASKSVIEKKLKQQKQNNQVDGLIYHPFQMPDKEGKNNNGWKYVNCQNNKPRASNNK